MTGSQLTWWVLATQTGHQRKCSKVWKTSPPKSLQRKFSFFSWNSLRYLSQRLVSCFLHKRSCSRAKPMRKGVQGLTICLQITCEERWCMFFSVWELMWPSTKSKKLATPHTWRPTCLLKQWLKWARSRRTQLEKSNSDWTRKPS